MDKAIVNTLISAAYSAALSPKDYDNIMDVFDDLMFVEEPPLLTKNNSSKYIMDPYLMAHFERAHDIHKKLGRQITAKPLDKRLVDMAPSPAIIFNRNENILAMNALAKKSSSKPCTALFEYCTHPQSLRHIRSFMTNKDGANILVEPCGLQADGNSNACIIVRKIDHDDEDNNDNHQTDKTDSHFFLTTIDLGFDRSKIALFQKTYDLTDAETDVAIRLADGQQPKEVSHIRHASLETIRTQIKMIKRKTDCRDIPDIVRLVYGFSTGLFVSSQVSKSLPAYMQQCSAFKKESSITLRDGRKMFYIEQGDMQGTPAVFIHDMLYGAELLDKTAEAASRQGLRIISPLRPGYGKSDKIKHAYSDKLLDEVARDICELLERLGIAKTMVVGHSVGIFYAMRFAKMFSNRTTFLLSVGHVPIWRDEWIAKLPKRQRIIARITKYVPKLLPLVTRTGVALIDEGRVDKFIDALHKDSPVDMKALKKPGIYNLICAGLQTSAAQGADAFRRDCIFPLIDYSHEAKNLGIPFHVLHGDKNMIIPPSHIETFAKIAPETTIETVKGAGRFLLYSHWEYVLNALKLAAKTCPK